MGCPNCANYKPKSDEEVKKLVSDIKKPMDEYCSIQSPVCDDCGFGKDRSPCPYTQILDILKKVESDL